MHVGCPHPRANAGGAYHTGTTMHDLTIRQFQDHIRQRYEPTDRKRGTPGTFLWFVEEIGELASALALEQAGKGDRQNLEEEFADVIAWLCTLANINDIDLAAAVARKYPADGGPEGVKS